jgi:phosphoglycolate phosphatase
MFQDDEVTSPIPCAGIIFDLDGTLLDSFRDIARSVNILLGEYGAQNLSDTQVRPCIGRGVAYLVERSFAAAHVMLEDSAVAVARYRDIYQEQALVSTRPYPGAVELLDALSGRPLAVLSNKPRHACVQILQHFGLLERFSIVAGGDSYPEMKPSPLPVLDIGRELGVIPDELLVVGDSTYDIIAGKQAGVRTCAITHGFQDKDALVNEDPDYIVPDLNRLRARLAGAQSK